MTSPIQDQINLLKEQLAAHEQEIPRPIDKINATTNRISELEYELAQTVQEREQRDQRQQEIIQTTTSVDILSQMFDSLLPASQFEVILGPNRYDILSQDFKQMIQAYATEALQSAHQQHDFEIAHKDERIKLLNDQSLAVQLQLDQANKTIKWTAEESAKLIQFEKYVAEEKAQALAILQEAYNGLKVEFDNLSDCYQARLADLQTQDTTIADLQAKIEAAQQPKAESKPSSKLSEMMTEIKTKNQLTADDMLARWNARQKSDDAKIPLPEVKVPEVPPFRGEDGSNPAADASNNQLPASEAAEIVGASFPVTPPGIPSIPSMAESTSVIRGSGDAPVTRQEFESRLVQVKEEIKHELLAKLAQGQVA